MSRPGFIGTVKDSQQGLSCITEQIGLWEVNPTLYQNQPSDVDLAKYLVRCYAFSSRNVRGTAYDRPGHSATPMVTQSFIPFPFVTAYKSIRSVWQSVRISLDSWFPPPPTLVCYARLRSKGCIWHLGYLTSEYAQWRALCVVTKEHIELVQLLSDPESISSNCDPSMDRESILLSELTNEDSSLKSVTSISKLSSLRSTKSTLRQSTKWELSYPDPYPQWRVVTFTSHLSKPSQYSSLVAIGHSNGSIDIIDLLPTDREVVGNGQTRIFIAPLCSQPSKDPRFSFFPIVHISFLDSNNLLVCHFSGHVDFWHLDWNTKRFPARLMVRFSPDQLHSGHRNLGPLTAADYDPHSKILVLSRLYSRSFLEGALPGRLALYCLRVTPAPPFLEPLKLARNTSRVSLTEGLFSRLTPITTAAFRLLTNSIRHFYQSLPLELDAVLCLRSQVTRNGSITAALQCSGICSVWSIPELHPLFILLAETAPLSTSLTAPAGAAASTGGNVSSRPFRITWWKTPTGTQTRSNHNTERSSALDDQPQLVILRENGEVNILQVTDTEANKLILTERQIHELNLSPNASFAHVNSQYSEHGSRNVLILDQKSNFDTLWKSTLYGAKGNEERRLIRAIRLASTTSSELFNHLIMKGSYDEAVDFARQHHFDVELVYQRQWLDFSSQPSCVYNLPDLIDRTLNFIRHRPIWVLKQCISFLPCTTSTAVTIGLSDFVLSIRYLLEHGLSRLNNISNEQLRSTVSMHLSRQLFHLQCLQNIITAEESEEISAPSTFEEDNRLYLLADLVEMLRVFRERSLLDVTLGYAHSQRFVAAKVLMRLLPLTIGQHRLAIASTLCETVDPTMYVTHLLELYFPIMDEPHYAVQKELEADAVDHLYSSFALQPNRDWMLTDKIDASTYLNRLTLWLMKRACQIEARTGLVSHAVSLLMAGKKVCSQLQATVTYSIEYATYLDQLDLLCWEFSHYSKVVYHQPNASGWRAARSSISVDPHHGRSIALARFTLSHYISLNLEDRVDLLLQCSSFGDTATSYVTPPLAHSMLVDWGQLILYTNRVLLGSNTYSKRRQEKLLAHILFRTAVHSGFQIHRRIVELISEGTISEIFPMDEQRANFPPFDSRLVAPSAIEFLTAIVQTISQFRPPTDAGTKEECRSSGTAELSVLRTYLKNVTNLIAPTLHCVLELQSSTTLDTTDHVELEKLCKHLHILNQCASAMSDLLTLATSLDRYQHSVVGLGIVSVGELVRCGYNSEQFQNLLTHWICYLTKFVSADWLSFSSASNQNVNDGTSSVQLNEYFDRLKAIFHKAFTDCPAVHWINVGIHYALLTAGDERLLEVSRQLHFNSLHPLRKAEEQPQEWYVSLLHALRSYVDSSLPEPLIIPDSRPQNMESMEPNERMARRCLFMFRSISIRSNAKERLQDSFDLEECILNAFAFISSASSLMLTDRQSDITAPFQLRSLWSRSPSLLQQRQSLFSNILFTILQSFQSYHTNRSKYMKILKSDMLYTIGRYFLLSAFDTADCLVHATFKYLAAYGDHLPPFDILDRTMELLLNVVSSSTQSAWSTCAQWAVHFTAHKKHQLCKPVKMDTKWTVLHGLFHIPRPSMEDSEIYTRPTSIVVTIESLRLLLSRIALAYCPVDHLDEMFRIFAMCGYRLDCALDEIGVDDRLYFPEFIQPLSDTLSAIIFDQIPWHCCGEAEDDGILYPFSYLPPLSPTPAALSERIRHGNSLCLKRDCSVPSFEINWWKLFIRCWLGDSSPPSFVKPQNNVPVTMDARLQFCYALLEPKVIELNLDPTLHAYLFDISQSIWSCGPCTANSSFDLLRPTSSERLRLALAAAGLGKCHSDLLQTDGCFPSGSVLASSISSVVESSGVLPTDAIAWLHQWCWRAIQSCLCVRLSSYLPGLDFDLYNTMKSNQREIIQRIGRTHVKLGIRLAVSARVPLHEVLCARLSTLLLEPHFSASQFESEIRRTMHWLSRFSDFNSEVIQWLSETIFPNLVDLHKLVILLDVLETDFNDVILDGLVVSVHREITSLLQTNEPGFLQSHNLPYAKLLAALSSPIPGGLFRSHLIFEHSQTKSLLTTFSRILDLISSNSPSTLRPGDLYAMHGLNVLNNSTSVANFCREHCSTLRSLLSDIAPSNDPIALERLVTWTHQLVFDPLGNCLEVDQRRWILNEVLHFINEYSPDHTQTSVFYGRIQSDLAQFNRISDELVHIDFPPMRDCLTNAASEACVIPETTFFGAFLTLPPHDNELTSLLFQRLIDRVNAGGDLSIESAVSTPCIETVAHSLRWFTRNLPMCFDAVQIDPQVELRTIKLAITSLPLPITSPLDAILAELPQCSGLKIPAFPHSITSALVEFIHSCSSKPNSPNCDAGYRSRLSLQELLGSLFADISIRRLHGPFLWHYFKDDTLAVNPISVFSIAFHILSEPLLSTTEANPILDFQEKLTSACSSLLSADHFMYDLLIPFLRLITIEVPLVPLNKSDAEPFETLMCDLLQSIVELFCLLFDMNSPNDSVPQDCRLTSSTDSPDPATVLWGLWFEFALRTKLLNSDNFLASMLLLEQWIKYGSPPPRGLGLASLRHFTLSLDSPSPSWPASLQAAVLSACFYQHDSSVILAALSVIALCSPSVIATIDSYACCFFVCLHGPIWVSLVETNKTPTYVCAPNPTLFTHIFMAVESFLSQHKTSAQVRPLCSHCVKHLHSANLWIEAIRLSRALYDLPGTVISLDTLVRRIHSMLQK